MSLHILKIKMSHSQTLLPLVEQICGAIRDNYGIVVFADLQGAFDSI